VSESAEPTQEELLAQIREIKVGQFLLSTGATLTSLAYGKLQARELDEARLAIDAIGALLPFLHGQIEDEPRRSLEQALTTLKLAYAEAAASSASSDQATE
jgi:hypothetical protein